MKRSYVLTFALGPGIPRESVVGPVNSALSSLTPLANFVQDAGLVTTLWRVTAAMASPSPLSAAWQADAFRASLQTWAPNQDPCRASNDPAWHRGQTHRGRRR